jgi:enoyl-CoA hydratase/carnithine racemase
MGHRKARPFVNTGNWLSAQDAWRLGMVNEVVPPADLSAYTEEMARKIAEEPLSGSTHQGSDQPDAGCAGTVELDADGVHHPRWRTRIGGN